MYQNFEENKQYLNSIDDSEDVTINLSADELELLLKYRSFTEEKKEEILNMLNE